MQLADGLSRIPLHAMAPSEPLKGEEEMDKQLTMIPLHDEAEGNPEVVVESEKGKEEKGERKEKKGEKEI